MAKLSGPAIAEAVKRGDIIIDPFVPERVGPNSYDLTLAPTLLTYLDPSPKMEFKIFHDINMGPVHKYHPWALDAKAENKAYKFDIPSEGLILTPGVLYLGHTNEVAGAHGYVPCIEGRSSVARLGMFVHITAGFGDDGFVGQWTLEIMVVHPVKIYQDMKICQVYFDTIEGERKPYAGKYNNSRGVVPSRLWQDFK